MMYVKAHADLIEKIDVIWMEARISNTLAEEIG